MPLLSRIYIDIKNCKDSYLQETIDSVRKNDNFKKQCLPKNSGYCPVCIHVTVFLLMLRVNFVSVQFVCPSIIKNIYIENFQFTTACKLFEQFTDPWELQNIYLKTLARFLIIIQLLSRIQINNYFEKYKLDETKLKVISSCKQLQTINKRSNQNIKYIEYSY